MAITTINVGAAANDGTGDTPRAAGQKINTNFTDSTNAASKLVVSNSTDTTADRVVTTGYDVKGFASTSELATAGSIMSVGGTGDAIELTSLYTGAATSYITGSEFEFTAIADSTVSTPTVDIDGLGAVTLNSFIVAGERYRIKYNGTSFDLDNVAAVKAYAISQLAGGDSTKVGTLVNGISVDALDYVVYPLNATIWATNGATGTSDGTLNTGTGAAGGVTGTLTLTQFSDAFKVATDLSGKTIASGSATFTNSTNNIALTDIGVGVEVGDVIQINGSTNNDTEFTIEFITDANNVVVNAAHAGKSRTVAPIGTKALIDETATVTVTLLCKWFNAGDSTGMGRVDVSGDRIAGVEYFGVKNRKISASIRTTFGIPVGNSSVESDGITESDSSSVSDSTTQRQGLRFTVISDAGYTVTLGRASETWVEIR